MNVSEVWNKKAFVRWAKLGSNEMEAALLRAAKVLIAPLEVAGFRWTDKTFDASGVPPHAINLERCGKSDSTDYVLIIFEKRRRPRFQVLFGSKGSSSPNPWIRSGALVWKRDSELVKYKWWGASWWHWDKVGSLSTAVDQVVSLMPQVLEYLSSGKVGENVLHEEIPHGKD